ncbi:MAG: hypothetical protein EYC68_14510 [Chloroflexota bacterium]|nr:MAG: hypothetical protein EYC68_14510 [Chloroflexota bacterium]
MTEIVAIAKSKWRARLCTSSRFHQPKTSRRKRCPDLVRSIVPAFPKMNLGTGSSKIIGFSNPFLTSI